MLQAIKQVGSNVGIIDTDDGVIEWVSTTQAQEYVRQGVNIAGVTPDGIKVDVIRLPYKFCNWCNGKNIFENIKRVSLNERQGKISIVCNNNKEFKGKYKDIGNDNIQIMFSINVITIVARQLLQK